MRRDAVFGFVVEGRVIIVFAGRGATRACGGVALVEEDLSKAATVREQEVHFPGFADGTQRLQSGEGLWKGWRVMYKIK